MPITDDRSTSTAPPPPPPSFVRRHPILAGFGVLSGLSLFTALWPVSAIVITVALAAHATGVDRVAWSLARKVEARVTQLLRGHRVGAPAPPASPAPSSPAPSAPQPPEPPAPSGPRHGVHAPAAPTRLGREARGHAGASHVSARPRRARTAEHPVESGVDGPGV